MKQPIAGDEKNQRDILFPLGVRDKVFDGFSLLVTAGPRLIINQMSGSWTNLWRDRSIAKADDVRVDLRLSDSVWGRIKHSCNHWWVAFFHPA